MFNDKYKFLSLLLVIMLSVACQKEKELAFDETANMRSAEVLNNTRAALKSAEHGWMGYLFSNKNNGYTFYFDFKDDYRVSMFSDFSEEYLHTGKESSYSMRNVGLPALIFDTYNYIHLLADPDNSLNGGTRGEGLYTDFEFAILELHPDLIVLEGILNKNKLVLRKASADEKKALTEGTFKNLKSEIEDYFFKNPFVYITEEGNSTQISFNVNLAERSITFSYLEEGVVEESKMGLAIGNDNLLLQRTFSVGDVSIKELKYRDGELIGIDSLGVDFQIRKDNNPLESLFDRLKTNRFNFFQLQKDNQQGEFQNIYNEVYDLVLDGGRTILYAEFRNKSLDTVTLNYRYMSSKEYNAYHDYQLILENNVARFKELPITGSGGSYGNYNSFIPRVIKMHDYLTTNTFELDYYTGMINGTIQTLARFRSVENPDSYILFNIE